MTKIFSKIFEFGEKHKKLFTLIDFVLSVSFIIFVLSFGLQCRELVDAAESDEDLLNFFAYGFFLGLAFPMFFELPSLIVDLIFEFIPSKKKNNRISSEKSD